MGVAANKAGVSEAAMLTATGKYPDEWFAILDQAGATAWTHTAIARWLSDRDVDGWWAQSVTVRYEQARGMRLPGQQSDGTFAVSASRSVDVGHGRSDHAAVLAALTGPMSASLGVVPAAVNAAAKYPTVRWGLPSGESLLATLSPVSAGKTSVSLTQSKILDHNQLTANKGQLKELLAQLPDWLSD
jgi:hypothetical protein